MCDKCQNKGCSNCSSEGGETAQLQNQVAELQDAINELSQAAKFLLCGHPVIFIEDKDDVDSFDTGTGKGTSCWEGWAICDGKTHLSSKGKKIVTPNLTERFIVGAGGQYAVGDTGGLEKVALSIAELPAHDHVLNDPTHAHILDDPQHDHGVTDPGHTHGAGSHTHTFETSTDGAHNHEVGVDNQGTGQRSGGDTDTAVSGVSTYTTTTAGNHSHSGTTDPASAGTSDEAFTGIDINPAATGISMREAATGITMDDTGSNEEHENRPPYFAGLFVKKIG